MDIETAQNFVSEIVDFYCDNKIGRELVPMDPISQLDIHPHDIACIKEFVGKNPVVEKPRSSLSSEKYVNFSGYKFLKVGYKRPNGYAAKNEPFIPTWILSAMILTRGLRDRGAKTVIDLFAGDGRIQYCASSIGLRSFGIEYCKALVKVQKQITKRTGVELGSIQGDAMQERDYSPFHLDKPAFFISALYSNEKTALDCLTSSLAKYTPELLQNSLFVTFDVVDNYPLKERCCLTLPTNWNTNEDYHISDFNFHNMKG